MARVHTIAKGKKARTCEKCREVIPAGAGYRYFQVGFRSSFKHIRCMKPECSPRPGDLTHSKMGQVYDAQMDALSTLDSLEMAEEHDVEAVKAVVDEYAEVVSEVQQEYAEAAENGPGGRGSGTISDERADILESAYSDLGYGSWSPDTDLPEPDESTYCADHGEDKIGDGDDEYEDEAALDQAREDCIACRDARNEQVDAAWTDLIEEARSIINDTEIP